MPISASSWIVLQSSMLHIMVCGYQQIDGYADAPRVEALRQGTTLHKIIMQFKGWETTTLSFITKRCHYNSIFYHEICLYNSIFFHETYLYNSIF